MFVYNENMAQKKKNELVVYYTRILSGSIFVWDFVELKIEIARFIMEVYKLIFLMILIVMIINHKRPGSKR